MTARAGWAEIEITPPLGLPMGGRGPRFTPGAEVLDPLMAQALVLEDGVGRRQIWISLDLIGLDYGRSAALRRDLAALTGADYESVVLNFAHVHSGPMTSFHKYPAMIPEPSLLRRYQAALRRAVLALAAEALARLQPVAVRLHRGASDVGVNRRRRNAEGEMVMGPNPDGLYNSDLWVLDLQATGGVDRYVVFNYGCHPVIVYGFAWDGISAGYPGVTRRQLQAQLGENVRSQFIQGLAGNIRPRVLADVEAGAFRKSKPEDVVEAGGALARDVTAALATPGLPLELALGAATGWISPRRDMDRTPDLAHWQAMAQGENELSRNVGGYWAQRMTSGQPLVAAEPMEIGLVQLAPACRAAWISAEPVAEWLGHLRAWLDDPGLTAWGYCQSVTTYLPTDALLVEGGYEVVNANWYSVQGPGPFAAGLDALVARGFGALARRIG